MEVHRLAHARTCSAEGEEKEAEDSRICYARLFWACPRGNTQLPDKKGSVDDWSPPTLRWGDFGMAVKDREVTMEGMVRSGGNERKYCISRLGHIGLVCIFLVLDSGKGLVNMSPWSRVRWKMRKK